MWHAIPKDDAWRQVTLRSIADLGRRLWLRCEHCGHEVVGEEPIAFSVHHRVGAASTRPELLLKASPEITTARRNLRAATRSLTMSRCRMGSERVIGP